MLAPINDRKKTAACRPLFSMGHPVRPVLPGFRRAMYLLVTYCCLIAAASAAGGMLPSLVHLTHHRIQMVLSLVCGVMLGVALLHLYPHSVQILGGNAGLASLLVLCGLLLMLFLIRIFNFHHHDFGAEHIHSSGCSPTDRNAHGLVESPVRAESSVPPASTSLPVIDGSTEAGIAHEKHVPSDLGWLGLVFGLGIHTLLDGIALAAAVQAEHGGHLLAGFGTFLAIALHKPLDAISITALMAAKRIPHSRQLVVNLVFALMAPVGAFAFMFSVDGLGEWRMVVLGAALAMSTGFFLCISLGDLLPEVHFHSHDRAWLSVMLLTGVGIAVILEYVIGHGSMAPQ
jgi:zinc and cadmium transporter